eukprot:351370-Chlamydomonas_euryale.AAC.1
MLAGRRNDARAAGRAAASRHAVGPADPGVCVVARRRRCERSGRPRVAGPDAHVARAAGAEQEPGGAAEGGRAARCGGGTADGGRACAAGSGAQMPAGTFVRGVCSSEEVGVSAFMLTQQNSLTDRPADLPADKPTDPPAKKPTDQPTSRPTDQPTNKPTNQPTKRPANQQTKRPTNQLTN